MAEQASVEITRGKQGKWSLKIKVKPAGEDLEEIQPIRIEIGREDDGRILASVPGRPRVMGRGVSVNEAIRKATSAALKVSKKKTA